jgi:hypothetical protein
MEDKNQDPFSFMDFTLEEAIEADESVETGRTRDGRVCVCGHPMTRHVFVAGLVFCKPTRMECPCKEQRAVIDTTDTRSFLRKTAGQGPLHALGRGLQNAIKAGHKVDWLIDMKCDRCETEGPIAPVAVSQRGVAMDEATGYDKLLCKQCRTEI